MNKDSFSKLVVDLYRIVNELEAMFPGRPFTPDGHLVGSLGEALVAHDYAVDLQRPSTAGYDALNAEKQQIEIKATQGKAVAFRSCPEFVIVIKLNRDGTYDEIYNGPGKLIWDCFEGKTMPKNGQHQIGLSKLQQLQNRVATNYRVPKRA